MVRFLATCSLLLLYPGALGAVAPSLTNPNTSSYNGQRYEAMVPDTIDLAERARLALKALTSAPNRDKDYSLYFYVHFSRNPPVAFRHLPVYPKFWEALPLMRVITGDEHNLHIDSRWRELLMEMLQSEHPPVGVDGGRALAALTIHYIKGKDPALQKIGDQAVLYWSKALVDKGTYCYAPARPGTQEMPKGWNATYCGWLVQGLAQYYAATGFVPARQLAEKLVRYLKEYAEVYDSQGRFLAYDNVERKSLHFHHHVNGLLGILEYAMAVKDKDLIEFARRGYEYARSTGSPLVGFFPEYIGSFPDERPYVDCEGCCVADMIIWAIMLTKAGAGDYWDDADHYIRNQFAEMQMTRSDWVYSMVEKLPPTPVAPNETADQVPERNLGAFAGWSLPNDFCSLEAPGIPAIQHCCTANCSRALYYAWNNILHRVSKNLYVNLLMNRASSWADVNSHIPYAGRVDVLVKKDCRLFIRAPEWVKADDNIECRIDGEKVRVQWEGRYLRLEAAKGGSLVTLTFPISRRTVKTTIAGKPYTLVIKGNEVISIDPPGKNYPYYERGHYLEGKARFKKVVRFVPRENAYPQVTNPPS